MSASSPESLASPAEEAATAPATRPRRGGRRRLVAVAVIVAALAALLIAWRLGDDGNPAIDGSRAITQDELEEQYGVHLDLVGLIASGGLVELRFRVTDADKATALFGDGEDLPVLAVEGTTRVLTSAEGMKHNFVLLDGASYFFLYTNVGDSVHEGTNLSFVVNGIRIPHLMARR